MRQKPAHKGIDVKLQCPRGVASVCRAEMLHSLAKTTGIFSDWLQSGDFNVDVDGVRSKLWREHHQSKGRRSVTKV